MKKSLCAFVFMLGLSATLSYGQDFDLKKDVIIRDKVPYAKFSGKMGMMKPADVMISSLNGDSLIAIKAWAYPSGNPVFSFLDGYEIRFVKSGRKIVKPCTVGLASKEQLLNFILNGRNYAGKWEDTFKQNLIVDNAVDPAAEAAFIEKFDNARAIEWAKEYEAKEKEVLAGIFPLQKDVNAKLKLESAGGSGTVETINIYQGKLLATIRKENKTAGIEKYVYTFEYRLNEKIKVGDKEIDTIVIATATADSFPKIFINAEGKSKSIEIKSPSSAEREITEYLIFNQKL